jgi:hypothetical protein
MEKSFNEDELADIMSEIESLESRDEEDFDSHDDDELEETSVHSIVAKKESPENSSHKKPHHSQMNFHIEGQMSMSLGFTVNGKEVQVKVSDNGMDIIMDNGATFHLPVSDDDEFDKVA